MFTILSLSTAPYSIALLAKVDELWSLIFLRISGLDNLASVRLPTVVEGLQGRETVKEETGDDRPNPLR